MLISYLEKVEKGYVEEKKVLEHECEELKLCLRRNDELIELLEETSDPNYESFSPRNVNAKNKMKIQELQDEKKQIQNDLEQKYKLCDEYTVKLEELHDVINSVVLDLKKFLDETELCSRLLEIDVNQCKEELRAMSKLLQNMMNQIKI